MYSSRILPLASTDIRDAANWYNKQAQGLGKRFSSEIRQKIKTICQNPDAYTIRYDDIRTAVLTKFPFSIHFSINEPLKTVIISAVLHTKRNIEI